MLVLLVLFLWFAAAAGVVYHYRRTELVQSVTQGFFAVWLSIYHAEDRVDGTRTHSDSQYEFGVNAGTVSLIIVVILLAIAFLWTVIDAAF